MKQRQYECGFCHGTFVMESSGPLRKWCPEHGTPYLRHQAEIQRLTCERCGQPWERDASIPGRIPKRCPQCTDDEIKTRGALRARGNRRQQRASSSGCRCGRDYLTVPLDEQWCPCEMSVMELAA